MGQFWYTDASGKRKRTKAGVKHELLKFQSSPKARKERAKRNAARRKMERAGRVHKGDNKDIHHRRGVAGGNSSSNLAVMSSAKNRGVREKSRKRGSRRASWKKT